MQTLDEYKEEIIQNMRFVGTYKESFANTIDAYARAMMDYDTACAAFESLGSKFMVKHTNKAGAENIVKNPYYLVIEELRRVMLAYATQLGLTPSGLKKINDEMKVKGGKSKLAEALENLR